MPLIAFDGFVGPGYTSRAKVADGERSMNLFSELIESRQGKSGARFVLYGTPGKKTFGAPPVPGQGRSIVAGDHRLFAAVGPKLYEVSPDGQTWKDLTPPLGAIADDGSPVQVLQNGLQLFVSSAGHGYLHDGISLTEVVVAYTSTFKDGYFIAQQPGTNNFQISKFRDGKIWNAIDYGVKEGGPDRLMSVGSDRNYLWLLGQQSSEAWVDTGAVNFPFQRADGGLIRAGIYAPWSLQELPDGLAWLGLDIRGGGVVWRTRGLELQRISNHALEYAFQQYLAKWGEPALSQATSHTYQEQGHVFYRIDFPLVNNGAGATWAYDQTTSDLTGIATWHERGFWNTKYSRYEADLGRFHAFVWAQHFVQDYKTGQIYAQSLDYFDDAGSPIRRLRSAPHISDKALWIFHHSIQIDMQVGVCAQGATPQSVLRVSDDGGYSYGNELQMSLGQIGQYRYQVKRRMLGRSRDRAYEWSTTEPMQIAITDAYLDVEEGNS